MLSHEMLNESLTLRLLQSVILKEAENLTVITSG